MSTHYEPEDRFFKMDLRNRRFPQIAPTCRYIRVMGTWFDPMVDFELIFDPEGIIRDVELPFRNSELKERIKDAIYAETRLTEIKITRVMEEDTETLAYGRATKRWQIMSRGQGDYEIEFESFFKVHLVGEGNTKKAVPGEKGQAAIHKWVEKTINKNALSFIFNPDPKQLGSRFEWKEAT